MFSSKKNVEHANFIENNYTEDFLEDICQKIEVKSDKKEVFKKCIKQAGLAYLNVKTLNSQRIQPHKQKEILLEYACALRELQEKYRQIEKYTTTSGKLHKALRRIVSETEEEGMKEMFNPYITLGDGKKKLGSISITLFEKFLGVLAEAAERAPTEKTGKDQKVLSGDFQAFWVARIRREWIECTDIPFQHGKTYKEIGDTINICPQILYELIIKIDPDVTKQRVNTSIRKVIKTDIDTPVANFIF